MERKLLVEIRYGVLRGFKQTQNVPLLNASGQVHSKHISFGVQASLLKLCDEAGPWRNIAEVGDRTTRKPSAGTP
jgi:hypothetical protein